MKGNPYIGKIANTGTQKVTVKQPEKRGTSKIKSGSDLRSGK